MSTPKVVFDADAARFLSTLQDMKSKALEGGDAVSKAKVKIVESMQEQTAAALKAGKGFDELVRIQTKGAERLASVTEQNAARTSAALDRLLDKQRKVAAELDAMGRIKAPASAAGHGFTDRMALSSVVRAGEGNPGIRSIENFLSMSPAVAAAARGIAPLIGAAGLAGMFFEMGEKAYEAAEKVKKLPQALKDGWEGVNEPIEMEADSLRKANAELEISIAHLEHKPANTLALQIADTRIEVDKLASSALKAAADIKKMLEENAPHGFFETAISWANGSVDTGPIGTEINKRMQERKEKALDLQDQVRSGKASPEQIADAKAAMRKMDEDNATWARGVYKDVKSFAKPGQADGMLNDALGFAQFSDNQVDVADQTDQNTKDQKRQKDLQDQAKQKQEAEESARKAAEQQMKTIEDSAAALKAKFADDHAAMLGAEAAFWDKMAHAPDILKANRAAVNDHYASAEQAYNNALVEYAKKALEEQKQVESQQRQQLETMSGVWITGGKRTADDQMVYWALQMFMLKEGSEAYLLALKKYNEAEARVRKEGEEAQQRADEAALQHDRNQGRIAEAGIKSQQRDGSISPHDAAVQDALLHKEEYDREKADLEKQLNDANKSGDAVEASKAKMGLDKLATDRVIQANEDAANIVATTWHGALSNAMRAWVQDSEDSAKQVVEITKQAIDGVNNDLASLMMNEHAPGQSAWKEFRKNLGNTERGLGKTAVTDGLKQLEAKTFGAKANGTKSNPYYVLNANGDVVPGGKSMQGLPSLGDVANSNSNDNSDGSSTGSKVGGFFSKLAGIAGSFFGFGGGKALGGDVFPGVAYDVGEMGRERFVPKTAGTIIPNNKLGGGDVYYQVSVANGVTPQQMDMHVRNALTEFHPRVVHASVKAVHDNRRRSTSAG